MSDKYINSYDETRLMYDQEVYIPHKISTDVSTISLQEDGIIRMDMHPVEEITVNDQKAIMDVIHEIGGGRSFCNLVVFKQYVNVDEEARQFSASPEGNIYTIADAFVINSVALKLVGNFYMQVNKPVKPTRIFTNEKDAIAWLHTFM